MKRFVRWSIFAVVSAGAFVWWRIPADESTARDRQPLSPTPSPAASAVPVVTSSGPMPGNNQAAVQKPVVAAARDGTVVIAALGSTPNTMQLQHWRSTDRGRTWDVPTAFPDWPTGADFACDPWLVTDHRGRFHLVQLATCIKNRSECPCVFRRSTDDGLTWEAPVRIAEGIDRPVIAVSPNGERLVVVGTMVDPDTKPPMTVVAGVYRSDNRGKTWKRLPGPPGVRSSVCFSTVIDDAGRIAAGWVLNDGKGSQSVMSTTADGGITWNMTVLVEALQPDRNHPFNGGRFPVVALDASGGLQAVYVEAGGKAVVSRVSQDWTAWSAEIRLSADAVAEVRMPAIAAAGNVIHVIWMERAGERFHMRYRASKDRGVIWTETQTLSRPNSTGFLTVCDDDQTAISDDGAGIAHAVWGTRGENGIVSQLWHATIEFQILRK